MKSISNKPFGNLFQLRWAEKLGRPECPYLIRWTLIFFGYSLRIHHWLRSDASTTYMHDHACNFISIILWGSYTNVTEQGRVNVKVGSFWYANAFKRHYLEIPRGGAWTLLFCSRPYHKWGFYVNSHKWRPLRFFDKFQHAPCDIQ